MIATNGGCDCTVAANRPVVLVRYRPGLAGEATRTVHIVALPLDGQHDAATALCGTTLQASEMEIVTPGQGMPRTRCLANQIAAGPPPPAPEPSSPAAHPDAGHQGMATDYHRWGWPITARRDQVRLSLAPDTAALIIPVPLATEMTEILTTRHCQPAVLTHPHAPEHRVLLAGEPYSVMLPWPAGVSRITTHLLLPPPTPTPRGPLRWTHPPQQILITALPGNRRTRRPPHHTPAITRRSGEEIAWASMTRSRGQTHHQRAQQRPRPAPRQASPHATSIASPNPTAPGSPSASG